MGSCGLPAPEVLWLVWFIYRCLSEAMKARREARRNLKASVHARGRAMELLRAPQENGTGGCAIKGAGSLFRGACVGTCVALASHLRGARRDGVRANAGFARKRP